MSSASVVGAVQERYGTLAVAATAPIWFDEVPLKRQDGTRILPPYVCLHDEGTTGQSDFELNWLETTRLRFEVYAPSLAQADAIEAGLRFNGQPTEARAGMDFAADLPLTGQTLQQMLWTGSRRFQERDRGADAGLVFRVRVSYEVTTLRRGS